MLLSLSPARRRGRSAVLGACLVLAAGACTNDPDPPGWTPVWSDDFDGAAGTGLARSDWSYATGTQYPGGAPQWGTGQIERSTDSTANVRHDGAGHLEILPLRDAAGAWTSGRVESRRDDFAAAPGGKVRIEAVLRQPQVTGPQAAGYWAAFWALGAPARPVASTNWPHAGEWDVMEVVNGRDSVWQTLHCGEPVGGPCGEPTGISSGEQPCPGCRTGFHTYAIELDRSVQPEQLRWYVDDKNTYTVTADKVDATTWERANHHGFFVILNVAIGGSFPASFGGGATPATQPGVPMVVDRVAVSKSEDG
ncbi:glycoside hydrolase family 16 protein [Actinoplanes sp. RD1]|uniref:glycoside hydrolase family 16 protein n=1 Tax=Actinoplanes sp. RD1 TaxID=3064538 RepID=UPI002741C4B8|nr:glycoside hydrolase family 16 protein [Actinoplanes sp. RD1]